MNTIIRTYLFLSILAITLCASDAAFGQRYKERGQQQDNTEYRKSQDNQDSLNHKSFKDRLVYGGNFWLELGNPNYIDVSPLVGYMLTPKWQAGVGGTYIYYGGQIPFFDQYGNLLGYVNEHATYYGGRLYTQYDIFHDALRPGDRFFGHFEYEMLNVPYQVNGLLTGRAWIESPYLGLGYRTPFGRSGFLNLTVLYNLDYARFQNLNPYGSPFSMRVGFTF
jgi:hypothetical protein